MDSPDGGLATNLDRLDIASQTPEYVALSPKRLQDLPTEIIQSILKPLVIWHSSDILNFGLASKWALSQAKPMLFRTVNFHITGSAQMESDIRWLERRLSKNNQFSSVRHIIISGSMPSASKTSRHKTVDRTKRGIYYRPYLRMENKLGASGCRGSCLQDAQPIETIIEVDHFWLPLAALLDKMTGLTDMTFGCSTRFPPCLLAAISNRTVRCKLHFYHFMLRSLDNDELLPHEIELMTSPCLSSIRLLNKQSREHDHITVNRRRRSSGMNQFHEAFGKLDRNYEAMRLMTTGLAPNLKEIRVAAEVSYWRRREDFEAAKRRPAWKHFAPLRAMKPWTEANLTSLHLTRGHFSPAETAAEELKEWMSLIDFRQLKVFKVHSIVTLPALELLANDVPFRDLKEFSFIDDSWVHSYPQPSDWGKRKMVLAELLMNIPSCEKLDLAYRITMRHIDAIAARHGQSLRDFQLRHHRIYSAFTHETVERLSRGCVNLERLRISMLRQNGQMEERALYEAMTNFPKLKGVYLYQFIPDLAQCMDRVITGPDAKLRFSGDTYKRILADGSIDEGLVRSIFNIISGGRDILRWVHIRQESAPVGTFGWTTHEKDKVAWLEYLGGEWFAKRSDNIDKHDIINVNPVHRHISRNDKLDIRTKLGQEPPDFPYVKIPVPLEPFFYSLWPDMEGSERWQDHWSPFVLAGRPSDC